MRLPERITICEVGTRDGFQIEPDFIATEQKIEVVDPPLRGRRAPHRGHLVRAPQGDPPAARRRDGHGRHPRGGPAPATPRWCPTTRAPRARWTRGVDAIHTVLSASESHNLANVNMTIAESLEKLARGGPDRRARAACICSAASPPRSAARSRATCRWRACDAVVARLVDMGARGIGLADTTGMANPRAGGGRARAPDAALSRRRVDAAHPRHARHGHPQHPGRDGARRDDTSTPRSAGSAAAPSRPAPPATCAPRIWCTACTRWASPPAIDLDRLIGVSRRVEQIVGRALPGQLDQGRALDAPLSRARHGRRVASAAHDQEGAADAGG